MAPIDSASTSGAAFVMGLATSLHCAGMCGPLTCGLLAMRREGADLLTGAISYHAGRMFSYGLLGGLAGATGEQVIGQFIHSPIMALPWVMAAALLFMAVGTPFRFPRPRRISAWSARLRLRVLRVPASGSSLALGLLTPLLPCAPLYLMLSVALASGSWWRGVEFMLAFAMGSMPLLWLAQHGYGHWLRRLGPRRMGFVRRGAALVAALVLIARLWPTASNGSASDRAPDCPFCRES